MQFLADAFDKILTSICWTMLIAHPYQHQVQAMIVTDIRYKPPDQLTDIFRQGLVEGDKQVGDDGDDGNDDEQDNDDDDDAWQGVTGCG